MRIKKYIFLIALTLILVLTFGFSQSRLDRKPIFKHNNNRTAPKLGHFRKNLSNRFKEKRFAPDQIMVRFNQVATKQSIDTTIEIYESKMLKKLSGDNLYLLQIPENSSVEEMVYVMNQNPMVKYAGPNFIARIAVTPNDTFFDFQYALFNSGQNIGPPGSPQGVDRADIKATAAWEETKGDEVIIVAVIDTGIDFQHPDLQNKVVSGGYDFVNDDSDANDDNGHGTFVAGIVAAETNNNEGVAGVAWNCKILPIKAMDAEGSGYYSDVIEGIYHAADNGADVINLSLGGEDTDLFLEEALEYATVEKNVVIVAAAGNEAGAVLYPAAYDEFCLAVSVTDYKDNRVEWSNFGPEIDVAAPGERIIGCVPTWYFGEGSIPYGWGEGSSFASPHVAGLAALLKSNKSWMTTEQIMNVIRYSADDVNHSDFPGIDDYIGYGRINLEKALVPIKIEK